MLIRVSDPVIAQTGEETLTTQRYDQAVYQHYIIVYHLYIIYISTYYQHKKKSTQKGRFMSLELQDAGKDHKTKSWVVTLAPNES